MFSNFFIHVPTESIDHSTELPPKMPTFLLCYFKQRIPSSCTFPWETLKTAQHTSKIYNLLIWGMGFHVEQQLENLCLPVSFFHSKKKRRRSQNTTHESGDNMQWGGHSPAVTVDSKPAKKLKYQFWHRKPRLKDIRPKCLYNRGMSARKAVSLWPPNHWAQRPLHAGAALKMIRLYFSKSFCLNECSVHATWVDHTWGFLCG